MNLVFAFDSFKGSMTSAQANDAAAAAARKIFTNAGISTFRMADGGEGTVAALAPALGCTIAYERVPGPLGSETNAVYAFNSLSGVAIIESAAASGLTLVPCEKRDVMRASSFGTGVQIAGALRRGASHIIIGVGGTACVDGGTGLLRALGARFYDASGRLLPTGAHILSDIARIDTSPLIETDARFTILSDVDTPLCGKHGAAPVFGPQKGATPEQVEILSIGLANFAAVAAGNLAHILGGGAGGGIAGALHRFFNAAIVPGADTVLELGGFDTIASGADLIFTGEGSLDRTTLCGKAPLAVLRRAQRLGTAVVAIGGRVNAREALVSAGFEAAEASTPAGTPPEVAMNTEFATAALGRAVENYLMTHFNRSDSF